MPTGQNRAERSERRVVPFLTREDLCHLSAGRAEGRRRESKGSQLREKREVLRFGRGSLYRVLAQDDKMNFAGGKERSAQSLLPRSAFTYSNSGMPW